MRVFVTIETGRPRGTSFRLAFGVQMAPVLVWIAFRLAGLI